MEEPPVSTARIVREANPAMFIDENETQASGGDSTMVQQMMTMLTEQYLSLVTTAFDDVKKKRVQAILASLVGNPLPPPSPEVSRRFIRMDFQGARMAEEAALHKAMDDLLLD